MKEIVRLVVDEGDFFEVHEHYAPNLIVGFARLDGRPVGIVGNQPRPSRACSTSSPPSRARASCVLRRLQHSLVTFEDVPGFLPGTEQEWGGNHPPRREAPVCLL